VTLVSTASLVDDAVARRSAVLAFNVITLEHAEAIAAGVGSNGAILQISENAVRFHGGDPMPLLLACRSIAEAAAAPLSLHLDHVEDPLLLDTGLAFHERWGLGSIMVDASRLDYADNVAMTSAFAVRAHARGLWVEAEIGRIGGKDGAHAPGIRTDPHEAARFAEATGVDGLAVAVGSSHAMRDRTATVDDALVARIAREVAVPLVLHGSSGVPDDVVRRAVLAGIRKVNVGTALNLAATATLRETLAARPELVDPRGYSNPVRAAMADVVAHFSALVD
jgi:fructose-bisphosphate aldolase class II